MTALTAPYGVNPVRPPDHKRTYTVRWSEQHKVYAATCDDFPGVASTSRYTAAKAVERLHKRLKEYDHAILYGASHEVAMKALKK